MWLDPQETSNLVTFTEETLNGKFHFFVRCVFEYTVDDNLKQVENTPILVLGIDKNSSTWIERKSKSRCQNGERPELKTKFWFIPMDMVDNLLSIM